MEKRLMMFLVSLFLSMGIATAQTQVSGTVISSEDNEPIIGASIIVQGSKAGKWSSVTLACSLRRSILRRT